MSLLLTLPQKNYDMNRRSGDICLVLLFVAAPFSFTACNKPPYKADYKNIKGYVIGKETCHANETNNYWLIDLTYRPDTPQYGDTLLLDSVTYTNVIKTKGLAEQLKEVGMKVSLDYKVITPNRIETGGCSVVNPVTYSLKELVILNQGEIR